MIFHCGKAEPRCGVQSGAEGHARVKNDRPSFPFWRLIPGRKNEQFLADGDRSVAGFP